MNKLSRRALFGASALGLVAIAGCNGVSSSITNGITTVTVNVQQLTEIAEGVLNAPSLLLPLIPGSTALSATIAPFVLKVSVALASFAAAAGKNTTLIINTTSDQAIVTSLISAIEDLYAQFSTYIAAQVGSGASAQIASYMEAFESLEVEAVNILDLIEGKASAPLRARLSHADALRILQAA